MRHLFLLFPVLLSLLSTPASAADVEKLLAQARQDQLSASPTWLALLHYQHTLLGVYESQADGAEFFLAETGKTDPAAELEADLKAFLRPSGQNHAQCRFPARWFWLKQQLSIADDHDVSCPKLQRWLDKADSDQLTLVFPAMYLNNPGSSFGHTFIRFDKSGSPVLLSYTLNYAAKTEGDNFLSYAYKGLSGGYNGIFAIRAYFETVQIYTDIENRDIWEYRLDYTQAEIQQLLRHIWEVTDTRFDYYFLGENCSYRLLTLLDAVRPEPALSSIENFPVYAIPVDTVRVLDDNGLIVDKQFRPSLASKIDFAHAASPDDFNQLSIQLAENEIGLDTIDLKISDETERAKLLEQTYDLLQFRGKSDSQLAQQILSKRSRLPETVSPEYEAQTPESGHDSVLAAVGGGEIRGHDVIQLQLRGSFHSLLDDPAGYVTGAEITSFDTRVSWSREKNKLQLEHFTFLSVTALAPMKSWNKPLSWKANISVERTALNATDSALAFVTSGGAGATVKLGEVFAFAMADFEINLSGLYAENYSLMTGASAGLYYPFGTGQLKLSYQDMSATMGQDVDRTRQEAGLAFNISREMAVQFGYEKTDYGVFESDQWLGKVNWYY